MAQAFLQIVAGSHEGTVVPLPPTDALVIGRKRGDLLLDDPLVSGKHAQIACSDGKFVLRDLGSTNGTLVDGRAAVEVVLKPGAEIAIGSCRLVFHLGSEPPAEPLASGQATAEQPDIAWLLDEELVELRGSGDRTRPQSDVIGQDLRLPPGLHAMVEVIAGADAGKSYRFTRGNVSVGRRQGEVPLSDVEVSRHHAVLEIFGREMVFLRDLGSTNGTYHNGRRVSLARLVDGDTVGCGKTVMRLTLARS